MRLGGPLPFGMDLQISVLFALLLAVGFCAGQDALPPGPVIGAVGGNVTFFTTVNPSTAPAFIVITWSFRNDSESQTVVTAAPDNTNTGPGYTDRVSVNRITGSLELRQLKLEDAGEYSVIMITSQAETLTGKTKLAVYKLVSDVTVRANGTDLVEFNDTVSLTCSASGSSLSYQWLNSSSDITASERVQLSDGNRILTISRVLRSDRGPLYCNVSNVISHAISKAINLNISFGPENVMMTVDPQKEFHSSGSNLTLSCSAQSSPPAQFQWAFNGGMLSREGQELKLENIEANQSGNYTCCAHNTRTLRYKCSDPALITVLEKISGASISGPTAVLIAGNSSANLSCQATTGTIISRKWLKDGQPLSPSNRIIISDDNSLVFINPVEGTDNGQYQCILANPVSTDTATYDLTVNYGPAEVVIQGKSEVEVNDMVELKCSASSEPPATFTWIVNGIETAMMTAEYVIENATYDNSGNYSCVARNAVTGLSVASPVHVLTVHGPGEKISIGAWIGIGIGCTVAVCLAVAVPTAIYIKKKSHSPTSRSAENTTSPYCNGGEPELNYADITHFQKSNGSQIHMGNIGTEYAEVTVNSKPGQAPMGQQETSYAEIRKN